MGASELAGDGIVGTFGNYFDGVVDDLEMYVYGDNGTNYGDFNLFADNEWIRNEIDNDPILNGTLIPGDVNKDGQVNGDGSGPASSDDVSAFIAGWGSQKVFQATHNSVTAGDWLTWENGDLNHDGVTNLFDWHILRTNHPTPAGLDLGQLLSGTTVPEPASVVLSAGLAVLVWYGRRCRSR